MNRSLMFRVVVIVFVAPIIGMFLDRLLGVQFGSGRDWLLFLTTLGVINYFFVYRWAKKQMEAIAKEHK